MLPKQNFDKSIMSSRCPSIFCPYFWPIAWRAPQRIGGSILRRMSQMYAMTIANPAFMHFHAGKQPLCSVYAEFDFHCRIAGDYQGAWVHTIRYKHI